MYVFLWKGLITFLSDFFLALMKRMVPFDTSATKEDSINVAGSDMKLQTERGKP